MSIPGFRWWIITLLFFASALNFFDRQVLSVLAPTILADLGMTNVEYSYIVAAFTLSYSVMFTLGGRLIDWAGARRGLGITVAFWSLASGLHAFAASPLQLGMFRFLLGVGEGGCFPGAAKGVVEWSPLRERSLAMGIATTGGSAAGAVLAPPLIVAAAGAFGWRGAFVMTGALGALWVALWFLLYRSPARSRFASAAELRLILDGRESRPSAANEPATSWRVLLGKKEVWGLVLTRFLLDPVFYFYMFWIPQYLSQERGASLELIGELAWIPFLTLGVASVAGGGLSDRLVRAGWSVKRARMTVLAGAAALTPISMMSVYAPSAEAAIVLMSVLMLAHGFWMTNYMTLIGDLFPSRDVATAVGLTGTAGGIGGFLSSLFVGRLIEAFTFTPAFLICGVLYPAGFAILAATIREVQPADAPA